MSMRRANQTVVNITTPQVFKGSPTLTVGNALAGDTQADCDYLDDGDGAKLSLALQAVNNSGIGGVVYARRGTYSINSSTALNLRGGTSLIGEGVGATIISANDTGFGDIVNIRGKSIRMEGVSVELPSSSAYTGSAAVIVDEISEFVTIRDCRFFGTLDKESSGRVFTMCYVKPSGTHRNIAVDSCVFETETNSEISATEASASIVVAALNGVTADFPDAVHITECYFHDRGEGAKNHCAVAVLGGPARVSGCVMPRQGNYAVWISPRYSPVDGSSVCDNQIFHGDGKWSVQVYNHEASSFEIRGVVVADNHVRISGSGSITTVGITAFTQSPTFDTSYVTITGNYVEAVGGIGVWLKAGGGAAANQCLVDGNHLSNSDTPLTDAGVGTFVGTNAT